MVYAMHLIPVCGERSNLQRVYLCSARAAFHRPGPAPVWMGYAFPDGDQGRRIDFFLKFSFLGRFGCRTLPGGDGCNRPGTQAEKIGR